jgi:hypothetical protein
MRLLYVEDESFQVGRAMMAVLRAELGAEVKVANTVEAARDLLMKTPFEAVILDVSADPGRPIVPPESFLVLAAELREGRYGVVNPAGSPLVFATAVWDLPVVVETERAQAWTYGGRTVKDVACSILGSEKPIVLQKPFLGTHLAKRIREAIGNAQQEKP